jgi:hypothetical protein
MKREMNFNVTIQFEENELYSHLQRIINNNSLGNNLKKLLDNKIKKAEEEHNVEFKIYNQEDFNRDIERVSKYIKNNLEINENSQDVEDDDMPF